MDHKMPDQRPLIDQLKTLQTLANRNGLYDAADWLEMKIKSWDKRIQDALTSGKHDG